MGKPNAYFERRRELNEHLRLLCRLQDRQCAYCFEHMSAKRRLGDGPRKSKKPRNPLGPTLDHVWPRSRGGSDLLINLVAVHGVCNTRKANRRPHGYELVAAQWVQALIEAEGNPRQAHAVLPGQVGVRDEPSEERLVP